MKKQLSAVFIVMIVLSVFASCSMFEENIDTIPSSGQSDIVNVKFNVQRPKSIDISYPSGMGEIYQYKASANFGKDVRGTQSEWKDFTNNSSVGYFAKGSWTFDVRVIYGTDTNFGVIASGSKTMTISDSANTVSFQLSNVVTSQTNGSLGLSITVGTVSNNEGNLEVYVDDKLTTVTDLTSTLSGTDRTFTGILVLPAGYHIVRINYLDKTVETSKPISSQTVNVRIVENATVNISGTLASGTYVDGTIFVTYPKLTASLSAPSGEIKTGVDNEFTCTATGADSITYSWYVNGANVKEDQTGKFKYKFTTGGIYNISCIVKAMDGDTAIFGCASLDVEVN